jgi:hypothetical protein
VGPVVLGVPVGKPGESVDQFALENMK